MNKNTTTLLTGIILALASAGAAAQSALQQLGSEAGIDAAPLAVQMKFVHDMGAVQTFGVPLAKKETDIFEDCSALQAEPLLAWNVTQAAILVQTCLNHTFPADSRYQVQAHAASFASRECPDGDGTAACQVTGIKITVSGQIMDGDSVLSDLNASLKQRGGKLLGFKTIVDNEAKIKL